MKQTAINMELPGLHERCRLITSPVDLLSSHIEAETIDWIITDPPYPFVEFLYQVRHKILPERIRQTLHDSASVETAYITVN